ncbi:MAG: hypothetical protein WC091_02675 [Sulfuricellaceae bacterium]
MSFNTEVSPIISNPNPYPDGAMAAAAWDAVVPAGSAIGDATALAKPLSVVTGADGTKGVVLPTPTFGTEQFMVYSATATSGLKIYPPSGGAINGGSASAAITIEGKSLALLIALDTSGNYAAIYTANS